MNPTPFGSVKHATVTKVFSGIDPRRPLLAVLEEDTFPYDKLFLTRTTHNFPPLPGQSVELSFCDGGSHGGCWKITKGIIRQGSMRCRLRGCRSDAVIEISGYALTKPGWWPVCLGHSRVFAARRRMKMPP